MRFNTSINNVKAKEWGLNLPLSYLFAWFYELPSWANKVVIENEIYYFASKNKAVQELPLLTEKKDTMYRYYKQIEKLGLIKIKKVDDKDYICLTKKAMGWNYSSDNSELNPTPRKQIRTTSETNPTPRKQIRTTSDLNPTPLGNKSDPPSDLNPTYNNTNTNNNTKDNSKTIIKSKNEKEKEVFTEKDFPKILIELGADETHVKDWMKSRKNKKATNSQTALKRFIKECSNHQYPIADAVKDCAENSWSGFKFEWLNNQKNGNRSNNNGNTSETNLGKIYADIDEMYGNE